MTISPILRIGTRGSPLALVQAREVARRLGEAHDELRPQGAIEIVVIKTTGDSFLDQPLAEIGGKGLFTKEIEDALLEGRVDLAVHSMKDVPTGLPDGLEISCVLPREDPRDAFFSPVASRLEDLPHGAVVGTASLRRGAQIKELRSDLEIVPFRGNVQTRLKKLEKGEVNATLLALAGLKRLGLRDMATAILPTDVILPAVAQGAIGLESRVGDEKTGNYLRPLNHCDTQICVMAERGLLRVLEGSCRTPIAALAEIVEKSDKTQIHMRALVASPDGRRVYRDTRSGEIEAALALGEEMGHFLKEKAGPDIFAGQS